MLLGGAPGRGEGMFSRSFGATIAIAGAVTALAACGGDNDSGGAGTKAGSSQASSKGATAIKPGKAGGAGRAGGVGAGGSEGGGGGEKTRGRGGGKLTVLASADVDYLDPGQT